MERVSIPLIERELGQVTYEHTIVQKLYGDIFIGDAERNYYVDRYHEINLCVHYNFRKPGTYSFFPEYQFYLTKGRMSLKLHWNLGIPVENMIIEKYNHIEAAKDSKYYKDFVELKENIGKEIERQKKRDDFDYKCNSMSWAYRQYPSGESYYTMIEISTGNGKECIQVHLDKEKDEWKVSKSSESIMNLWRYLKDFEEINEKYLHLMEYLPMKNNSLDENSPYYKFWVDAKEKFLKKNDISYT